MDRLRTHVRHGEDRSESADEPDDLCPAPLRVEARQEIVADVRGALARLPERTRWVVYAVYGQERTYEQVAEETGIPLGTVKRYLREGMAALRREFAEELEGE
jgi:RNA polymerase sigma-70 factor (ECF subfamily)